VKSVRENSRRSSKGAERAAATTTPSAEPAEGPALNGEAWSYPPDATGDQQQDTRGSSLHLESASILTLRH
jgi:hypothetical protein